MNPFILEFRQLHPKITMWTIAIVVAAILSYSCVGFFYILFGAPDVLSIEDICLEMKVGASAPE